jgi:peptide chain release factor 3
MENTNMQNQVKPRRTFAIISHPDAGKTTLTEKLLLFGGAIRLAGTVKGRKSKIYATSDWMQIEKERGISVTSSAMQFSYNGININILDTPGHQDFSEDTYRTLVAADSAVMLIDLVKGVEAQTIKLFKVCRMRGIPIFTFINKLDRFGKEPLDVLEEIERVMGINTYPMNWPVGMGQDFRAIYDRRNRCLELYRNGRAEREFVYADQRGVEDPAINACLEPSLYEKLVEDMALLDIAGNPYDEDMIQKGTLSPVFFGSALSSIGVQNFLENFLVMAPEPRPQKSTAGYIQPDDPNFSGFIFKIQANMNPAHRDRIAFLRVCSGRFERGMSVNHVRSGKKIKLPQPQQFLAQDRDILEEAYPGDVVGLFDPGIFRIGDTLCAEGTFEFEKLPQFSPEHFAKIFNLDISKYKQFQKGIRQLKEEGMVQIFRTFMDGAEEIIVGVVGELQFEVLEYRLANEYGTKIKLDYLSFRLARWVKSEKTVDPGDLRGLKNLCVKDQDDRLVVLLEDEYYLNRLKDKYPEIIFHTASNI